MQINTGEITRVELELGETIEICFRPKVRSPQAILGVQIGTREFLKGEMSLTVTMPSGSTYEPDWTLSPDDGDDDYLKYLITSNSEEGKRFCGAGYSSNDYSLSDVLIGAWERVRARMRMLGMNSQDDKL